MCSEQWLLQNLFEQFYLVIACTFENALGCFLYDKLRLSGIKILIQDQVIK